MADERGYPLCQRCAEIDFDLLLSEETLNGPSLGNISAIVRGLCKLCDFFYDILPPGLKDDSAQPKSYRLQSITCAENLEELDFLAFQRRNNGLPFLLKTPNTRILALDFDGEKFSDDAHGLRQSFVIARSPTSPWIEVVPNDIDFCMINKWLHMCTTEHSGCREIPHAIIPLRLIDCHERKVIPSCGITEYVTLSYVWGFPKTVLLGASKLPESGLSISLPQTIEDAISVTTRLGYRYLWIDRYCIDQGNEAEFHNQIKRMDRIYRDSVLTIIDASGKDPHHGLPGTRPNSRKFHQPAIRIGSHHLLSSMEPPERAV